MKKNYTFTLSTFILNVVFLSVLLCSNQLFAQQNIGAHPNIDAGFESQSVGSLPSQSSTAPNTSATYWAYSVSGNGQIKSVSATGG